MSTDSPEVEDPYITKAKQALVEARKCEVGPIHPVDFLRNILRKHGIRPLDIKTTHLEIEELSTRYAKLKAIDCLDKARRLQTTEDWAAKTRQWLGVARLQPEDIGTTEAELARRSEASKFNRTERDPHKWI